MTEALKLPQPDVAVEESTIADLRIVTESVQISAGERVLADLREGASWVTDYSGCEANGGVPRRYRRVLLTGRAALRAVQ